LPRKPLAPVTRVTLSVMGVANLLKIFGSFRGAPKA